MLHDPGKIGNNRNGPRSGPRNGNHYNLWCYKDCFATRKLLQLFLCALMIWLVVILFRYNFVAPLNDSRYKVANDTQHISYEMEISRYRQLVSKVLSHEFLTHKGELKAMWPETKFIVDADNKKIERLRYLVTEIRRDARIVKCEIDKTLPLEKNFSSVFIASNLHDSRDVLPNFITQVIKFIIQNENIKIFVSIYESGSTDDTEFWLTLFKSILTDLNVQNSIVSNGTEYRHPNQQRIDFLAKVRNKAIDPMWYDDGIFGQWERLIFINDIYFCNSDLDRLLLYDQDDIVCGMDFVFAEMTISRTKEKFKDTAKEDLTKKLYYLERATTEEEKTRLKMKNLNGNKWQQARVKKSTPSTAARAVMRFYDIWVAHDITGAHFANSPPYIRADASTRDRLKLGLPVPVECCWNGMVSLNTKPFENGVRFRSHYENECPTSECILMCHDFQRMGFRHTILDPSIKTSYSYPVATRTRNETSHELPFKNWSEVKNETAMERKPFKLNHTVDCCPLHKGNDHVDFAECYTWNMWSYNNTKTPQ